MKVIDLTGRRFGTLFVLSRSPRQGRTFWTCKCDCGRSTEVVGHTLRVGKTKSCGCRRGDTGRAMWTTHGLKRSGVAPTPEYTCWAHMRRRCSDPKSPDFKNYGGRGIKVCQRWQDFALFLTDMGTRPAGHTIERKNNDADYSPENCVWATRAEQNQNKRNVLHLPAYGEQLTIRQIVSRSGLGYACIYKRFRKGLSGAALLEGAR